MAPPDASTARAELEEQARGLGIDKIDGLDDDELVDAIVDRQQAAGPPPPPPPAAEPTAPARPDDRPEDTSGRPPLDEVAADRAANRRVRDRDAEAEARRDAQEEVE